MKKIVSFLLFIFCLSMSATAVAFTEDPVAVIILDNGYSGVNQELRQVWESRVKRRFRFPDYKLLAEKEIKDALWGRLPALEGKRPYFREQQLVQIADTVPAELVFVIWVERLDEEIIQSYRLFGETLCKVDVSIDVTAYRKTDAKFLVQKIRYYKIDHIAISSSANKVATDEIAEAVNKFKEQLPRLEGKEKQAKI